MIIADLVESKTHKNLLQFHSSRYFKIVAVPPSNPHQRGVGGPPFKIPPVVVI